MLYAPHLLEPTPVLSVSSILRELRENFPPPTSSSSSAKGSEGGSGSGSGSGGGGGSKVGAWDADIVRDALCCLRAHPSCTVVEEEEGKWRFHIRAALLALQLKTVEMWVSERFGGGQPLAARILRTLLDKGMLEEKTVSDLVLADARAVRVFLWKMLGEGLLTTQEVPKRPDRNPQFTAVLFCAVSQGSPSPPHFLC